MNYKIDIQFVNYFYSFESSEKEVLDLFRKCFKKRKPFFIKVDNSEVHLNFENALYMTIEKKIADEPPK